MTEREVWDRVLPVAVTLVERNTVLGGKTMKIGSLCYQVFIGRDVEPGLLLVVMRCFDTCGGDHGAIMERFRLTNREAQVAQLFGDRYSNREIADVLGVTIHTVGRHVEHIFKKMNTNSRSGVRASLTGCHMGACSNPSPDAR